MSGKADEHKKKIKELADLMHDVVNNPKATDEDLEHIVLSLRAVDAHRLDTAANGCPG